MPLPEHAGPLVPVLFEPGGWGGICHYTYSLAQALARRSLRPHLVTASPYELQTFDIDFDLTTEIDTVGSYTTNLRVIQDVLGRIPGSLLHVQATLSARRDWAPLLLLRLVGCPYVLTAHNVYPHDRAERDAAGMGLALDLIYRNASAIIVHGEAIRSELLDNFPIERSRVVEIPMGDYAFTRSSTVPERDRACVELGLNPADSVSLAFGAMRPYKGLGNLVDAFCQVRGRRPNAHLLIVGKPVGVSKEELLARARAGGIEHCVTIVDAYVPFEQIGTYFAASDIVVFPYEKVYQSAAIQVAYAYEKPVIVTRVGALPETVKDGVNGRIVAPHSNNQLAEAMVELLGKGLKALAAMGKKSGELASASHNWDTIAELTTCVYDQVVGETTLAA